MKRPEVFAERAASSRDFATKARKHGVWCEGCHAQVIADHLQGQPTTATTTSTSLASESAEHTVHLLHELAAPTGEGATHFTQEHKSRQIRRCSARAQARPAEDGEGKEQEGQGGRTVSTEVLQPSAVDLDPAARR